MTKKLTTNTKIDIKKAIELRRIKGLTFTEIGNMMGVSRQAVHQALKQFEKVLLPSEELRAYRGNKADILESIEFELLNDTIDIDKRQKASLNNVAYTLGTLNNMTRLEKGQSTTNVSFKDMSDSLEDIKRERMQLEEALRSV